MRARAPGAERRRAGPLDKGVAARRAALFLLDGVLRQGHSLDSLTAGEPAALARLEPRDRAFARLLATTVLRRLGQIDAVLEAFLERALPARAGPTRAILRLGAAQILFLGTPSHAAVASAMALASDLAPAFKGLVNAVLRRLAAEGPALVAAQDATGLNTPDWLWESWVDAYGTEGARAIAEAHLVQPPLDLTLKLAADRDEWAARLEAEILPTGTLRRPAGGRIEDLSGFAEGVWWVQDAAAALPARLLGAVEGRTVLDLCAAPGGKTAQLVAAGARVIAVDRDAGRMERLEENLARLSLAADCVTADAAEWRPERPADAVLLDAPCSATGTIRRHPDVPHRKRKEDLPGLLALQERLFDAAVDMVKPGGVLVYCTCSLQPEEGPERVASLLARGAPMRRRPILPEDVGGLAELVTADGDLRTLPSHLAESGGLDGFYACRLERL